MTVYHYNATLLMGADRSDSHFRPLERPFAAEGGVSGQPLYAAGTVSTPTFSFQPVSTGFPIRATK
jgi:hypothetical protein